MASERYILPVLPIGQDQVDMVRLFRLYGDAQRELARFTGLLSGVPYAHVLLSPLLMQEAVLSSRIEGTMSTLDEVYETEAGEEATERQKCDTQEILNYRQALRYGAHCLAERGLTLGLLKEMHAILLESVRGQGKQPGQVRTTQNWIGSRNCPIGQAAYVPPAPETLDAYLDNWVDYVRTDDWDPLLKSGILHAQFELIHPFNDGNGRIGRLFIPLYLTSVGLLEQPNFYLSEYLERHRDEYTGCLNCLHRKESAWTDWLEFYLRAVIAQAGENSRRAAAIRRLHAELMEEFCEVTNSSFAPKLLDAVFANPIFTRSQVCGAVPGLNASTVQRMMDLLAKNGTIKVKRQGSGRKPTLYHLEELTLLATGLPIRRFTY